ncbi:MAG: hypothetical protein IH944_02750 [Armatimonadetes bacterium]|nr:hypothetical protein [Armatimonadota bacterium]
MATNRYTVFGGEILAENRAGTKRDYVPDSLGSTRALLNSSQTQTDTYDYWPYGEEKSHTGASVTPFTFVGAYGYFSGDAGGTYVRARWYSGSHGAWTTSDPLWPSLLPYQYANASPESLIDPLGLSCCGQDRWGLGIPKQDPKPKEDPKPIDNPRDCGAKCVKDGFDSYIYWVCPDGTIVCKCCDGVMGQEFTICPGQVCEGKPIKKKCPKRPPPPPNEDSLEDCIEKCIFDCSKNRPTDWSCVWRCVLLRCLIFGGKGLGKRGGLTITYAAIPGTTWGISYGSRR